MQEAPQPTNVVPIQTQTTARESKRPLRGKNQRVEHKILDLDAPNDQSSKVIRTMSDEMKKCYKILQALKKHQCSEPFLNPVDPVALKIPDYYNIVKEPIDLSTVEKNLKNGVYQSPLQF